MPFVVRLSQLAIWPTSGVEVTLHANCKGTERVLGKIYGAEKTKEYLFFVKKVLKKLNRGSANIVSL